MSPFCLSPHWDILSRSENRSAALIFLARHKTAILGVTLLLGYGGPEGQAASLSTRGSWPWGGKAPLTALVLIARPPCWKSLGAPAVRLPALCSEPPLFSCGEDQLLSYTKDKKHPNAGVCYQTFFKYFFMFSNPAFTDSRTELSFTPSSRATSR